MCDIGNGERPFEADAMRPPGMLMSDSTKLMRTVGYIEQRMVEIRRAFKGDYRLTLLARNVEFDDGSRDFTMTDDSLEVAGKAMCRQKGYATGRFPLSWDVGNLYDEEQSDDLRFRLTGRRDLADVEMRSADYTLLSEVIEWMEAAIEALRK